MKENKTLAELYQVSQRHDFGDISLLIENQGGKLRGKFVFHPIESDTSVLEKTLSQKELPTCFGRPPAVIDDDLTSAVVWDEKYRTLGDVIPIIEKEVAQFGKMLEALGNQLAMCAHCLVFDRCYKIAEFNLHRKQAGIKIEGKWTM